MDATLYPLAASPRVFNPLTFHLLTYPGLEDAIEAELAGLPKTTAGVPPFECSRPEERPGCVQVRFASAPDRPLHLRSVQLVLQPLTTVRCSESAALDEWVSQIGSAVPPEFYRRALAGAQGFRVVCERKGQHGFGSPEIERRVGAIAQAASEAKVRMKGWDVALRVEIRGDVAHVDRWSAPAARPALPFHLQTALKPSVAYAMLRLGLGAHAAPRSVCDPFCGTGTIVAEAARLYPSASLFASDKFDKPACGTRDNLAALGFADRAQVVTADARQLEQAWPARRFDAIVANPPFGVRLGPNLSWQRWYLQLLDSAAAALEPDGRFVLLVGQRGAFDRALAERPRWQRLHTRVFDMNGVFPAMVVLRMNSGSAERS